MGGNFSKNQAAAADASANPADKKKDVETMISEYFESNDFKKDMDKLSGLVDRYNEGDMKKLFASIINEYDLDASEKEAMKKVIQPHIDHLDRIGYNEIQDAFKQNKLYQGFVDRYAKKSSDLLKDSVDKFPMFAEDIKKFVSGVTNISSREQFFKFHYLYSQIWILMYIKSINGAVVDFTTTSIDIFNKIEVSRTKNTQQLIERLLALLAADTGALNEDDFRYFKTSLDKLKEKLQEDVGKSKEQLLKARESMVGQLTQQTGNLKVDLSAEAPAAAPQEPPGPQQGFQQQRFNQGGKRNGGKQNGGFVRDGSRFPEAFFAQPTKTFDQFGGQSFDELNRS